MIAEAVLRSLKVNGADYLFANAGGDFAPIIEAMSAVNNEAATIVRDDRCQVPVDVTVAPD